MADSTVINAIQELRQDDIIIAFMGITGAGKSYFIDLLTGEEGKRSSNSLQSATAEIEATRVRHPKTGAANIVLVDTPGFDDTTRSDMQILKMISDWLEQTYTLDVKLSGLVYLHRISDNRVASGPSRNFCTFDKLCGDSAASNVVLVSTMWGMVQPEEGEQMESALKEQLWKPLIDKGSGVDRLRRSDCWEAWRIVDSLIGKHRSREALLLQKELVDLKLKLNETEAGKTLYTMLQKHLANHKDSLKATIDQLEKTSDPKLKKKLEKDYKKVQAQFEKTFDEVAKNLNVPLGRRIQEFFGKKTHVKAVKIREVKF